MVKIKIPHWKLFLIKKLTIWPRAVVYLLTYLFLSFIHHFNTDVDTNWNFRLLGITNWLNLKGIIGIGFFLLVKAIIYFAYFLLLEYLFDKLNRLDLSKEFLQVVADKTFSLNNVIYKIRKVVLFKRKNKGKLVVCEDDFANDFEVGFFVNNAPGKVKEKNYVKETSWWKTGIIMPLVLSLAIILAFSPYF